MKDKYSARFNKKRKPATKVYVLMERFEILGVFSSAKKATEAKAWLIEHDDVCRRYHADLRIDIFELNGEWIETLNNTKLI